MEQRQEIVEEKNKTDKNTLTTTYGLRDDSNTLYDLSVDLFKLVTCLHACMHDSYYGQIS